LNYEFKDKVDVLPLYCGTVATKWFGQNVKAKGFMLTPEDVVNGCLRDLGRESLTFGAWKHEIFGRILPKNETVKRNLYNTFD
jgi:hypothetical protein